MLNAAVARATARADKMKKLQSAFGGGSAEPSKKRQAEVAREQKSEKKAKVDVQATNTGNDKVLGKSNYKTKVPKGKAMDAVMKCIGLEDANSRRFLSDSIEGRSIVLANTNKQSIASKGSNRALAQSKRQKKRASNTCLKKHKLIDPYQVPNRKDLEAINALWVDFISQLSDACNNDAQFQARFHSTGLIGARIRVLETDPSHRLRKVKPNASTNTDTNTSLGGLICHESANCLYVLPDNNNLDLDLNLDLNLDLPDNNEGKGRGQGQGQGPNYGQVQGPKYGQGRGQGQGQGQQRVRRLVKDSCRLSVTLEGGKEVVLHGQKFISPAKSIRSQMKKKKKKN